MKEQIFFLNLQSQNSMKHSLNNVQFSVQNSAYYLVHLYDDQLFATACLDWSAATSSTLSSSVAGGALFQSGVSLPSPWAPSAATQYRCRCCC